MILEDFFEPEVLKLSQELTQIRHDIDFREDILASGRLNIGGIAFTLHIHNKLLDQEEAIIERLLRLVGC